MSTAEKMQTPNHLDRWRAIVHSFPSLSRHLRADCAPEDVAQFLRSAAVTSVSKHAALFALAVWSGSNASMKAWRVGQFDAVSAVAAWDSEHVAAFVRWCEAPYWP